MKGEPLFTRVDDEIDFYWDNDLPHQLMPANDFGIHWVTDLVPPVSGTYHLGTWASSAYEMKLNGDTLLSFRDEHHGFHKGVPVELKAGEKYRIEMFYRNYSGDADMKLLWAMPRENLVRRCCGKRITGRCSHPCAGPLTSAWRVRRWG